MDDKAIENLKEALQFSPDNIPLRLHLAETLVNYNRLEEAETEYQTILSQDQYNVSAKFGLCKVFYQNGQYSKCNVILEALIQSNPSFDILLLHTRALVKENSIQKAVQIYKKVLSMNPKKEVDLKIIQPLLHPEIYKAYGKKTGGGILLYGPPGCGKTYLAKATAGQVNARFVSVSLSDILDMWIGSSEKNLHEVFQLSRANKPCVLFFDEIDALGASRSLD